MGLPKNDRGQCDIIKKWIDLMKGLNTENIPHYQHNMISMPQDKCQEKNGIISINWK